MGIVEKPADNRESLGAYGGRLGACEQICGTWVKSCGAVGKPCRVWEKHCYCGRSQ